MENIQEKLKGLLRLYLSYIKISLYGVVFYVCLASIYEVLNGAFSSLIVFFLSLGIGIIMWFLPRKESLQSLPFAVAIKLSDLLPTKYRQNLQQEISDARLEYYETLSERNILRARFIIISYYIGLSWSVVMWMLDKVKEAIGLVPKKD